MGDFSNTYDALFLFYVVNAEFGIPKASTIRRFPLQIMRPNIFLQKLPVGLCCPTLLITIIFRADQEPRPLLKRPDHQT